MEPEGHSIFSSLMDRLTQQSLLNSIYNVEPLRLMLGCYLQDMLMLASQHVLPCMHSLHQLRKRRHIGPKSRESPSPVDHVFNQLLAPIRCGVSGFQWCGNAEGNQRNAHAVLIVQQQIQRPPERASDSLILCLKQVRGLRIVLNRTTCVPISNHATCIHLWQVTHTVA